MLTKIKSLRIDVLRPWRRKISSKFCSPVHGDERKGTRGSTRPKKISPVQKIQITPRAIRRCRASHCIMGLYQQGFGPDHRFQYSTMFAVNTTAVVPGVPLLARSVGWETQAPRLRRNRALAITNLSVHVVSARRVRFPDRGP